MNAPPHWSDSRIGEDCALAEAAFRENRMREPLAKYTDTITAARAVFHELFVLTDDLRRLDAQAAVVLTQPRYADTVRYLSGPPVSADDLEVVAQTSLAPGALRRDPAAVRRVLAAIRDGLDGARFPWILADRAPSAGEREAAILASAALLAAQRVATDRRTEGKETQELAVCAALSAQGFTQVPPRTIQFLTDAPRRGEFCRESLLGTRKADVGVGMRDGRVMPIEAKVSNSAVNSIKRLNNDAAVKAVRWLEEFGRVQIVPAAVLGGVFSPANVVRAQAAGLTIWWAHELSALTTYLDAAR